MKKIVLSSMAVLSLAAVSFAGVTTTGKSYKQPEPVTCFNDSEFQLDIFGSYNFAGDYQDGFGGGGSLNYYFTRNIGFQVDYNIYDGDVSGRHEVTGSLLLRLPIDSTCLAPYALVGGGVGMDGTTEALFTAGAGVEYRVVPHRVGIFAEGRYLLGDDSDSAGAARVGLRFVF